MMKKIVCLGLDVDQARELIPKILVQCRPYLDNTTFPDDLKCEDISNFWFEPRGSFDESSNDYVLQTRTNRSYIRGDRIELEYSTQYNDRDCGNYGQSGLAIYFGIQGDAYDNPEKVDEAVQTLSDFLTGEAINFVVKP
jgi:hypothetical protein